MGFGVIGEGRRFPRFASLGIDVEVRPVSSGEDLEIDGRAYQATFRREKIQQVDKGVDRNASSQFVHRVPLGSGNLLWMPLPLEASDDTAPGEALPFASHRPARLSLLKLM